MVPQNSNRIVAFRSAQGRPFAERKATLVIALVLALFSGVMARDAVGAELHVQPTTVQIGDACIKW